MTTKKPPSNLRVINTDPPKPEPDSKLVEVCAELLRKAEAGELRGLVFVGDIVTKGPGSTHGMLGHISVRSYGYLTAIHQELGTQIVEVILDSENDHG